MLFLIQFKNDVMNDGAVCSPQDLYTALELIGDEYCLEAQMWAEECMVGDTYNDDYCRVTAAFDDRFC